MAKRFTFTVIDGKGVQTFTGFLKPFTSTQAYPPTLAVALSEGEPEMWLLEGTTDESMKEGLSELGRYYRQAGFEKVRIAVYCRHRIVDGYGDKET